ncbi:metal-dependent hydrolase [Cyclobacterium marinum]|uniref:metal-dependent hydrolase n=1 Tax=Cyclobacterium marinum TaxID=104 RepID=UPI001659B6EA|nr:metal-dependent hydrolase [Cyclobacterium marinum]MBI0397873.1 metal-dependent hydrolase [Cyclobacterium marinum]|tara:strand:- start:71864 stop:72547 length:684 start_codon:yes stop_codon:yes gene_type:complete
MIELKYFGHSTFLVTIGGKSLIFDPFISPNPLASNIEIDKIKTDYVLVSHGHEDHVFDVETIVTNNEATLVSNFEIVTWFQNKGVKNVWGMNHGGSKVFDFGKIKYVNAVHSSALPDGTNGGNPGGFVVESEHGTFYYAGDTALSYDMKLIGESFDVDFAILPIGDNFTMGITDALKAAEFVGTDKIIGMHYDTFEPIIIDRIKVKREAEKSGKELILLNIGESISL